MNILKIFRLVAIILVAYAICIGCEGISIDETQTTAQKNTDLEYYASSNFKDFLTEEDALPVDDLEELDCLTMER